MSALTARLLSGRTTPSTGRVLEQQDPAQRAADLHVERRDASRVDVAREGGEPRGAT